MRLETFIKKFDQLSDAAGAVVKLREIVLDLGVKGKLTDRDLNKESVGSKYSDEPSSGRLPANWRLLNFGKYCDIQGGNQPPKSQFSDQPKPGYVRMFQIRDLGDRPVPVYISANSTNRFCRAGEILIGRYGASVGKVFWAQDGAYNVALAKFIFPEDALVPAFAFWVLKSNFFQAEIAGASRSAQAGFNKGDLAAIDFPLPPLVEQKRIVAKVDELMALCDQLEAQQQERETRHAALARASLARFADAPNPANLEFLFHKSYTISPADLRKAILTLAVQGQLVPQDLNDPAVGDSVVAARKSAGLPARPLSDIAPDERPFEVPKSWRWVTVADVAETRLGKMLDIEKNRGDAHPYLRNTNVHWFRFELESVKSMLFEPAELDEYRVKLGDVLICEGGHGIARSAVWGGQIPGIMFQKALHRVRPLSCLNGHFLTFCLWVFERDEILQRYYTGAGIPHFTGKALAQVRFPLPPLAEQRRIIAKVDQLMKLVDELEAQLSARRTAAANLLEAVVSELTLAA